MMVEAATNHPGTREISILVLHTLAHVLHMRERLTEILASLFNIVRVHLKSMIIKIVLIY